MGLGGQEEHERRRSTDHEAESDDPCGIKASLGAFLGERYSVRRSPRGVRIADSARLTSPSSLLARMAS